MPLIQMIQLGKTKFCHQNQPGRGNFLFIKPTVDAQPNNSGRPEICRCRQSFDPLPLCNNDGTRADKANFRDDLCPHTRNAS